MLYLDEIGLEISVKEGINDYGDEDGYDDESGYGHDDDKPILSARMLCSVKNFGSIMRFMPSSAILD